MIRPPRFPVVFESLEKRTFLSAGQLDPFFGSQGTIRQSIGSGGAALISMQVMPNGKIIAAGSNGANPNGRLYLARYNVNGEPDTTFGGLAGAPAGVVFTDIAANSGVLKLMPDGRLLFLSGTRLVRFHGDGVIDPKFTQDTLTTFRYAFSGIDMDVQPDGKVVIAGRYRQTLVNRGQFAVARLRCNGTRDKTFAARGVADFGPKIPGLANAVRVMPDGSIFATGFYNHGYPNDMDEFMREDALCMKFKSDGSLDAGYGVNGIASRTGRYFAGSTMYGLIAGDGSSTIFALGDDLRFMRFDANGQSTNSAANYVDNSSHPMALALQSNGDSLIIPPRWADDTSTTRADRILRFLPDGSADKSFGNQGLASLDLHGDEVIFNAIEIAYDGSILAGGASEGKLLIARYWRDDAPAAQLFAPDITSAGIASQAFTISLRDDVKLNVSSIDESDFVVIAPDGSQFIPTVKDINTDQKDKLCDVMLKLAPPGGRWDSKDNGAYQVKVLNSRISDAAGHKMGGRTIGAFQVNIPTTAVLA